MCPGNLPAGQVSHHRDILLRLKLAGIPATPLGGELRFAVHRPGNPVASPRFATCPAAMFLAAFTSALQAKPQATHGDAAWLSRDSLAVCPHALTYLQGISATLVFRNAAGAEVAKDGC